MNLAKLNSRDTEVVEEYVRKKFKSFAGFTYSKSTRMRKCEEYYIAAADTPASQAVIERVYQEVFKQVLDIDRARQRVAAAKKPGKHKVESSAWLEMQEDRGNEISEALDKLRRWKAEGDYQMGEAFFAELCTTVAFVDESICDTMNFQTEYSAQCRAHIGHEVTLTKKEIEAQFDLMLGVTQNASCSFETRVGNWGEINAKLEESFKAGAWANGEAKAKLGRMGFSAEVQAAIAIGAQLNVEGQLAWSKGRAQLALGGEGELFVGARAGGEAKLSVNALKGINMALKAGAFAGFSAEVTGTCAFSYDGKTIASVAGSAAITFGAGAEFEASLKAPIFGPTSISIGANLTLGLGSEVKTEVAINFSEAALAASENFRKVVYWRTLARGYQMTLMNSDARNLYYLNKAIARLEAELANTAETIESFAKVPMEKRSLLMEV